MAMRVLRTDPLMLQAQLLECCQVSLTGRQSYKTYAIAEQQVIN